MENQKSKLFLMEVLIERIEQMRVENHISMDVLCTRAHMAKKTYIALKKQEAVYVLRSHPSPAKRFL